jgi:hypothetical protein
MISFFLKQSYRTHKVLHGTSYSSAFEVKLQLQEYSPTGVLNEAFMSPTLMKGDSQKP